MKTNKLIKKKISKSYIKNTDNKKNSIVFQIKKHTKPKKLGKKFNYEFEHMTDKIIRFSDEYINVLGLESMPIQAFININTTNLIKKHERIIYEEVLNSVEPLKNFKAFKKNIKKEDNIKSALIILNIAREENVQKYLEVFANLGIRVNVCYNDLIGFNECIFIDLDKINYADELDVKEVKEMKEVKNMYDMILGYNIEIMDNLGYLFYL